MFTRITTTSISFVKSTILGLLGITVMCLGLGWVNVHAINSLYTWGDNPQGQLGTNGTTDSSTPLALTSMEGVIDIAGGREYSGAVHSIALKSDGTVWTWGRNNNGQLGNNSTIDRSTPVQVRGPNNSGFLTDIIDIDAGGTFSIALKSDGTVWTWGVNSSNQLGDNTTTRRLTPVQVKGPNNVGFLTDITAISAGQYHGIAIKKDGTVWTWGRNDFAQLGDGSYTQRPTPVQVKSPDGLGFFTGVVSVAAGLNHTLVIKSDGTVWGWGRNNYGRLGDNTSTHRELPVQTKGSGGTGFLTGITKVAASSISSIALKSDGTVWTWGKNDFGQIGDNTTVTERLAPVRVVGVGGTGFLTGVIDVFAGGDSVYALRSDGTALAWGSNTQGQLGDGTTTTRRSPVIIKGVGGTGNLSGVWKLTGGDFHTLAIQDAGCGSASAGVSCTTLNISGGNLQLYAPDSTNNNDICSTPDIQNSTVVDTTTSDQNSTSVTCSTQDQRIQLNGVSVSTTRQNATATFHDLIVDDLRGSNSSNNYTISLSLTDFVDNQDPNKKIILGTNPDNQSSDLDPDAPTGANAGKLFAAIDPSNSTKSVIRPKVGQTNSWQNRFTPGAKQTIISANTSVTIVSTNYSTPAGRFDFDGMTLKVRIPAYTKPGNYQSTMTITVI